MFVGAVADSDRTVRSVVDEISRHLPNASALFSVSNGVAIACWTGAGLERSVFTDDCAYVGNVRGEFPGPTTELRGDFALVARTNDRLRLARGRFAGRPLYWMRIEKTVIACSRMLPLMVLAGRNARLNLDHVLAQFDPGFGLLKAPLPIAGARRVRNNEVIDINAAGETCVFSGPVSIGPELRASAHELSSELRREFRSAVERQCVGVSRVAVMCGGGVDSSNLLAIAVHNARHRRTAEVIPVALDFGGQGDDRPHLRTVCAHLGIEPLRVAPASGARYAGCGYVVDGSAHATVPQSTIFPIMATAKAAGAELVLLGEGAECVLDAAPPVFVDFLLKHPFRAIGCASRFQAIYETRVQSWRRLMFGPLMHHILPSFVRAQRLRQAHNRSLMGTVNILAWAGPRLRSFLTRRREYPNSKPIQSQRDRIVALASSELLMGFRELYSRWEIATDIPMSFPYLDDDYVRFVGRIPSSAIFAGARERGLLRESMKDLVPDSVRYRMDKARGDEAFAELFSAMNEYPKSTDLLTMRELESLGVVDARRFRGAFRRFAADPYADPWCWRAVWGAITAEAYVRWFNELRTHPLPFALSDPPAMVPP
jgi:asparagine synthetase B (glutamine-hydrolysing)